MMIDFKIIVQADELLYENYKKNSEIMFRKLKKWQSPWHTLF